MRPCGEFKLATRRCLVGCMSQREAVSLEWDSHGCLNDFWCGSWYVLFLAKLVFDHRPYEISLGGRLLNTTATKMSINRQHNKSPPCSSSNLTNDNVWPRFFIVEAADDNTQPLTKRCKIFALNIAIKGMGGSYESVKPLNGGRQLLVHFENKIYSKNLLETNELAGIPVKVSPHRRLNYSRCVLFCKELACIEEEEIKNNWSHKV